MVDREQVGAMADKDEVAEPHWVAGCPRCRQIGLWCRGMEWVDLYLIALGHRENLKRWPRAWNEEDAPDNEEGA